MNPTDYSITFACYNSVAYTRLCIESMVKHGTPLNRLVVVDNGSTDETRQYLQELPLGGRIFNSQNLGCGVAWNQGALALQSEWSIIMNNDVLVSPQWIENLIQVAIEKNLKVISPSMIEGLQDYDFDTFAHKANQKMSSAIRVGDRHAVCLAIHKSVWMEVGYFQPIPKLLGYEDTMFFHELSKANILTAITGASWLHHFGSVTQTAMKLERGLNQKDGLSNRYNYRLLNQPWLKRKLAKAKRTRQKLEWRHEELQAYQMTMHGLRVHGDFEWI